MLTLHKLEIFSVVAQEGSFSGAAERLYITQSAVSQHIRDMEKGLGTDLFIRGRRGVTPTRAGETLYEYACQVLRLVAAAENAVTNVEKLESGQIGIGATPGVNVYLLPQWIQAFRGRFPNLTVSLQTDVTPNITKLVLRHRFDIGFVEGELHNQVDERLGHLDLKDIELYVLIGQGHAWWNHESIPIEWLQDHPFITRQQNSQTRAWIDAILQPENVKPQIVAELDNPESIKQAVMSGMGVTILPTYAIQNEQRAGILKAIKIDGIPLKRTLTLVWDKEMLFSPITRAFLQYLAREFPPLNDILEYDVTKN